MDAAIARDRVVASAWQVLEPTGFEGFEVADVIRTAGASTKTFYRWFESKDALFTELLPSAAREARELLLRPLIEVISTGDFGSAEPVADAKIIHGMCRPPLIDIVTGAAESDAADALITRVKCFALRGLRPEHARHPR
jgi:AcrR family transcriptional regulator